MIEQHVVAIQHDVSCPCTGPGQKHQGELRVFPTVVKWAEVDVPERRATP